MNRFLPCLVLFAFPCLLPAQSKNAATEIWSGRWEDPLLEKWVSGSGEVGSGPEGERTVSLYGGGWHEGGHDCHVTLVDDSTGWSEHCPVCDEYRGGATRVGIRHVAGETLLVHLGEGEEWLDWLGPEPAWRMGQPWPLFELWRALAGEWEPVEDPMAHRLQISGQRCEVKWRKGWTPLNMLFEEMDIPVRDAVRIEGEGAFRVALQGDRLTWTTLKDVGAEYDVVQWEETDEVTEFRRVSSMALAPLKGLLGMHPELSLSTVNRKQLDRSPGELRRMRNEIFARHGWRFQSEDLRAHFEAMDGYAPVEDNAAVELSAVEAFNANWIREREDALRSRLPAWHDPEIRFGMEWSQYEDADLDPAQSADGTGRHWMIVHRDGHFDVVHARLVPQADEDMVLFRGVEVEGMEARLVATFVPGPMDPKGIRHFDCPRTVSQGQTVTLGPDRFVSRIVDREENGIYHQLQFQRVAPDGRFTGGQPEATWLEFAQGLEWAGDLNGDGRTDFILTGSRKSSLMRFQFWLSNPMTGTLELVADRELAGC